MGALGNTVRQTLRKLACRTPVDQLVKRGVKEVNVVGLDHIVALIEEAVHRSLRHKLMGIERVEAAGAAREEFMRLLRSHENLERSHDEAVRLRERAEEEIDDLRRQIAEQDRLLRERLAQGELDLRAGHEGENGEIARKVDDIFVALAAAPGGELSDLRDRVLELVMDIVEQERHVATQARQAAHDREVERLERRIAKLKSSLERTESTLAAGPADEGISSIYREVQGLDEADRQYQRKRELMTLLFEANMALQKGFEVRKS